MSIIRLLHYSLLFIKFQFSVIVSPLLVYFMAIIMENVLQGWQNFPLIYITGQFHILMIFSSFFLGTAKIWNSLHAESLPWSFSLNYFKTNVNRYIAFSLNLLPLCYVVAEYPCKVSSYLKKNKDKKSSTMYFCHP